MLKTVMKAKFLIIASLIFLSSTVEVQPQSTTDTTKKRRRKNTRLRLLKPSHLAQKRSGHLVKQPCDG
jgi:hypothetical protein